MRHNPTHMIVSKMINNAKSPERPATMYNHIRKLLDLFSKRLSEVGRKFSDISCVVIVDLCFDDDGYKNDGNEDICDVMKTVENVEVVANENDV